MTFTVPDRLPGYNELTRGHWSARQRLKETHMGIVVWCAKIDGVRPVKGLVEISITCYEPNHRRDHDNVVAGAAKIIMDALKNMGIIQGDGQKYVRYVPQPVQVDRIKPRVEIEIREV